MGCEKRRQAALPLVPGCGQRPAGLVPENKESCETEFISNVISNTFSETRVAWNKRASRLVSCS